MIEKGRIQYFDILKAISIFLVVFCHIVILKYDGYLDNISMLVCWMAVPCFLLVNVAILLNKKLDLKKHYKKVLLIYIVNIIWKIIYLLFYVCINKFDLVNVSKFDLLKYIFLFGNLKNINTDHFYFIKALLAIYIIFPIIHCSFNDEKNGKKNLGIILIFIIIFTYGINIIEFIVKYIIKDNRMTFTEIKDVFLFGKYAIFLLFFVLGGYIHFYREKIEKIKHRKLICILAICISLILLAVSKYIINGTFQWKGIYLQNGYDNIATCILSIAFFILVQNLSIKNKYLSKVFTEIGSSTLGIYYIHIPILTLFSIYLYRYIYFKGVFINTIKSILVILISYVIIRIIRKIPILKKIVI